jgi:hypothetical protein
VEAIYWDNTRVAQHRRDSKPGGYTTLAEHMPPQPHRGCHLRPNRAHRPSHRAERGIGAKTLYPPRCAGLEHLIRAMRHFFCLEGGAC